MATAWQGTEKGKVGISASKISQKKTHGRMVGGKNINVSHANTCQRMSPVEEVLNNPVDRVIGQGSSASP